MENFEKKEKPISKLRKELENFGIDITDWGKGNAKTLKDLQREIDDGETTIIIDEKRNEIFKQTNVVGANIYYLNGNKTFRLKEFKQVFKDGRERVREHEQSIAEKMKKLEDPDKAILRGIQEELGINDNIKMMKKESYTKIKESMSYPGLKSSYIIHDYDIFLDKNQYEENGYKEEQEDKITYFTWEEIK